MKSILLRVAQAAKEPSSWAGVAAMLGGIGLFGFSADLWSQIFSAVMGVAGVMAVIISEKS